MADEISGGPPVRRPARTVLLVLVAVAVIVAGLMGLRRGEPARPVAAPTTPAFSYEPEPVPTGLPPAVGALGLRGLCAVRSDYRTTLEVEFALENSTAAPVTLVAVTPRLPLGGLRVRGTSVRSGSCRDTGAAVREAGAVPGRGIVVVTFRLGLPATCPQALPVLATVRDRAAGRDVTAEVTLLADLGGIRFETC